ncbi:sigma-70 family RNA polymerase sigma factor [Erysipelothrix inopinata]|uniref:Sigma-70 family RNA polymerase sigma factor n=1 Tax=Erysipelothrix inopinata TaxID=225084 RepID=A0A7G9RYM9_9FIRM|nr:sigma-70 family RNA polymerase sigma factor [Erysipelothrix inopinata]QNN60704.1 sigma-70 family RNA polymerase sigma factor [Erysipelothrix inopinata]
MGIRMSVSKDAKSIKSDRPKDFEELYNETHKMVFYIISRLVRNHHTVQDLVQDTYISAFENIDQLDDLDNFQAWVNRIASNKAKDFLKKKKPNLFTDLVKESDQDYTYEVKDTHTFDRPDIFAGNQEVTNVIQEVLFQIPEDQRLCVMMFYFEDMTTREIAESLNVSENSIKSRLRYAKEKIKHLLEAAEGDGFHLYGFNPLVFFIAGMKASPNIIPFDSGMVFQNITQSLNGAMSGATDNLILKHNSNQFSQTVQTFVVTACSLTLFMNMIMPQDDPFSLPYIDTKTSYENTLSDNQEVYDDQSLPSTTNNSTITHHSPDEPVTLMTQSEVNLIEYLDIRITGTSGNAVLALALKPTQDVGLNQYLQSIKINSNKNTKLKNNETISFEAQAPAHENYVLKKKTWDYTVSNLKENNQVTSSKPSGDISYVKDVKNFVDAYLSDTSILEMYLNQNQRDVEGNLLTFDAGSTYRKMTTHIGTDSKYRYGYVEYQIDANTIPVYLGILVKIPIESSDNLDVTSAVSKDASFNLKNYLGNDAIHWDQ